MYFFILQSAALLMLSGLGAYAVFSNTSLRTDIARKNISIGLIMGMTAFLISSNASGIEGIRDPLGANVGPLVFSGYLGGPVGGLIAGSIGAFDRIHVGGPNLWSDAAFYLLFGLLGAAARQLCPLKDWPTISKRIFLCLVPAALALNYAMEAMEIGRAAGSSTPLRQAAELPVAFSITLSIMFTGLVLHIANSFAQTSRHSAEIDQRLKLATRVAKIGVFQRDAGTEHAELDEEMLAILGLDQASGAIATTEWRKMVHPDDMEQLRRESRKVWAGSQRTGSSVVRITRPDGELRYVQVHWTAEPYSGANVERIVGTYQDLTDTIQLEQSKSQVEDRLATIIENLPGALHSVVIYPDGEMESTYISPSCMAIWGYNSAAFAEDPMLFQKLHDPDDLPQMMADFRKAAETLEPYSRRHKITSKDGTNKWLEMHASATRLDDGSTRIDSIFLDVTAEVFAQAQLEKQIALTYQALKNESVGQLTGGVAHDFNNLLAVIMGNLELLREETTNEDHIELIDAGIAASMRGADLTRNMLAFARRARLDPHIIDLNRLVRDTKNWSSRTIQANISIETSLPEDLWPVEADPSSTESALLNLMLNARDAMENGGKLTIETANITIDDTYIDSRNVDLYAGLYVMLAVSDTGHGIPDDIVNNIFEPFFTTKAPGKGSGLGLSMIQGFMRQSGGAVQVYSEAGVGTTFKLYFKAAHTGAVPVTIAPRTIKIPQRNGRILIAEDQEDVLKMLVTSLEKAGYTVTAAKSGDEALARYKADPDFDLLLTDIVMPGSLQGTQLAKILREIRPTLPVVFMSGYAREATVHGNGLHPDDIRLMKPVQRNDLLAAIAKSLGYPD